MTSRALTLSVRALREGTRAKAPYIMRGMLLATLMLAVWSVHEQSRFMNVGGQWLLSWVAWADFFLITLLGISAFSAVITEEKELMTLGLLRLAGFTPASILLGKSAGLLINALLLVVVQAPFLMLAVTFGGVKLDQVMSVLVLLLAYTLFCYALALFGSVVQRRNSGAAAFTTSVLVAYHALPNIGRGLVYELGLPAALDRFFTGWWETTAVHGLFFVTSRFGAFRSLDFTSHITVNLGLAAVFFALAWLLFDRFNRNELPSAPTRSAVLPWQRSANRTSHRSFENALFWKDYRFLSGGKRGLLFRGIIYALFFLVVMTLSGAPRRAQELGEFMMGSMLVAIPLELGIQASRVFQQEVKEKTLGSLLALPRSLGYVMTSKLAGAAILALPAVGYFLLGLLIAPDSFADVFEAVVDEPGAWYFVAQIVLGLFLTVFYSLRFQRAAMALAIATVFLGNFFFGMLLFGVGSSGEGVLCMGVPLTAFLCFVLANGITTRLRQLAAEA